MQHINDAFQDDCTIESRCQFYAVGGCLDILPNSTQMTIGSDHYWDIARRMRKDLHREPSLEDEETVNIQRHSTFEEQRLLFGGRQLEDGSSLARPRNLAAATRNASMAH